MNTAKTQEERAREWLSAAVERERDILAARAFAAGIELGPECIRAEDGQVVGWWPELAPLTPTERDDVRRTVAAEFVAQFEKAQERRMPAEG